VKGAKCRRTSNCQWHTPIDCSICMEVIHFGKGDLTTSCRHHFHEECMLKWFIQDSTCPVCRSRQENKYTAFRDEIRDNMSGIYMEVINTLEDDLRQARRAARRARRAE
jgi:hypothetical protein